MFAANGDWARVVPAARQSLAADPEDAATLSLLTLGLANLKQSADAIESGRRAVSVDPELPFAHYALGHALLAHDDVPAAEKAAREALRLDPDSEAYSLLGHVFARQRRWLDALDAAEQGLQLDAEHTGCANLRAMALSALGRTDEAERVSRRTLAADPDDAASHANRGWLLLRQSNYEEALESFRTALRLDATLESARGGIIEALKARHGIYRVVLRYALWMGTLDARSRWFIVIGLFVGARIARTMLRENPSWSPVLGPALALYGLFALSTWLADPISNLLLRLNPFGRLVLSHAEILASNIVGGLLVTAVVGGVLFAVTSVTGWLLVAVVAFLMLIPVSGAFSTRDTRAWGPMRAILVTLAALGVSAAVLGFVAIELAMWPLIGLAIGTFTFGWIANYFIIKFS
jgi:tetratricopeptide (TPR) repeat protein